MLDQLDLSLTMKGKEERSRLAEAQKRLLQLRLHLGGQIGGELGPGLLVVFEGWDAAGKGGCIKRLLGGQDPRHYAVHQFAAPTSREKRHHFLWRFWPHVPGHGGLVVFDRSWYGRVLVERVEGLCTQDEWERSYHEIVAFENTLASEGVIVAKFWLHISDEEQLKRFERRDDDPLKRWKLTDEDWRNREKREAYETALEDMLVRTSTPAAPWNLIEADSKRYARVKVIDTVIDQIESGMREWGMEIPGPIEQ